MHLKLLQRKKLYKNVIKSLIKWNWSNYTSQLLCLMFMDYQSHNLSLKVDYLFQSFLVITVECFLYIFNIYTIITLQKNIIFLGRDIKRGQQGKANVYKNLYFNIRLRTSAFQKVSYFVHTIKTERKMTITLKKSPKIAKMKKSHFFFCGHTISQLEKNLSCIFVLRLPSFIWKKCCSVDHWPPFLKMLSAMSAVCFSIIQW